MFKINQSTSFFWPVTVMLPADGGKHQKETFDAEFKRLPQSRLKEMQGLIERGEINDDAFVREVLLGWKGITDGGDEVPFSEGALSQVLDVSGVAGAIVMAYADAQSGLARKNS